MIYISNLSSLKTDLYFKLRKIVTYKSKVPVFGEDAIEEVDPELEKYN